MEKTTTRAKRKPDNAKSDALAQITTPPHSIEAEQAVLGGILLANDRWDTVAERVEASEFYTYAHRLIFTEIQNLMNEQKPVDVITLEQALQARGISDDVGGMAYLAELSQNTPSAANIGVYADIVREKAILRELISVGNSITEKSYNTQGMHYKELLDEAERLVFQIAEKRTQTNEGPVGVKQLLQDVITRIESLSRTNSSGITGLSTGFTALDRKTSGLQKSDLIIIAARPSMGKTTFAMNICENVALLNDIEEEENGVKVKKPAKPVLVFSLEMPAEQLMLRILASQAGVDQTRLKTGQLDDNEWGRVGTAVKILSSRPNIFIDDSAGLTPTELRSRARRLYREHKGLSMIMVDYLQLMRAPEFAEHREREIAEISRSLKALAKELQVPVIALAQLNRSLEQRQDKRPVNADLRESGSIEQDADLIMFIYRDEVYNGDNSDSKGLAEIIIGKQRNGPIGRVKLTFQGQYSRFANYEGYYNEDFDE